MSDKISSDTYDFGIRLKELRKKANLKQSDVASRLNVHEGTISAYENNTRTPSVEILIELAIIYRTSTDYILGLDKRKPIYVDDLDTKYQEYIEESIDSFRKIIGSK